MSNSTSSSSRGPLLAAVAGCLVLGVGLAVMAMQMRVLQQQLDETKSQSSTGATGKNGLSKEAMLRKLLNERETEYAKLQTQYKTLEARLNPSAERSQAVEVPAPRTERANDSRNRVSWMERLQKEDPERDKQMQEERERRRQAVDNLFKDQLTRLDQRLQSAQSQDEVNLVTQLSQTVGKLNDLRQQWQQLRDSPGDQAREQFEQLGTQTRDAYETLSTLRAQDRQMQLQQIATQAGYQDPQAAKQFSDAIQRIYNETDTSMSRMMGWGRGGGDGGGRGGPPGR